MSEQTEDRNLKARFRHVDTASETYEAITEAQIRDDTIRWVNLAKAGGDLVVALSKGEVGEALEPAKTLARALLEVEEAQVRLLRSIDDNVKLLRDGPFSTGRLHLSEAHRLVADPVRCRRHIDRAEDHFFEAHGLSAELIDQASVEMHIALIAILQGYHEDALHWLAQAYARASLKARELAEETGNTRVKKGRGIVQGVTAYFTIGASAAYLAAKKIKRTRSDKRAQEGLRVVLPLVNCISSLHHASGGEPSALPALRLIKAGPDLYELVEVPIDPPAWAPPLGANPVVSRELEG